MIERLSEKLPDRLKFAAHCAFRKSGYLYGEEWKLFVRDPEMRNALEERFQQLSQISLDLKLESFEDLIIQEQESSFVFPHADVLFYYGSLYVGGKEGLYSASRGGNRLPISKSKKIWDGPVLNLSANVFTLALASGSEGLFEYDLDKREGIKDVRQVSRTQCNSTRWLYTSVYSISYDQSFIADYSTPRISRSPSREEVMRLKMKREFLRFIDSEELFPRTNSQTKYTWGAHDKICRLYQDFVDIVRYSPVDREIAQRFRHIGSARIDPLIGKKQVINSDSAVFGYIVEYEDGIFIINSQLETFWLEGEPTNWRVFPNSADYTNQLHVIYDDYLSVLSFNTDYFVDQEQKTVGLRRGD